MLKMTREDYDFDFNRILKELDPEEIYRDLRLMGGEDPILLCWESPNTWCHRRRVAEWLEEALGIEIPEYEFKRNEILPYQQLGPLPPPPVNPQLELF
jgi:hypothetical protein